MIPSVALEQMLANQRTQAEYAVCQALTHQRVGDEDRALEIALKNSANRLAWRKRAGLPLRPSQTETEKWQAWLRLQSLLGWYRRRRPQSPPVLRVVRSRRHNPNNEPPLAA